MPAKSKFLNRAALVLVVTALSGLAISQTAPNLVIRVGYAPVNGLNLSYEIHGTGQPLILIDGDIGRRSLTLSSARRFTNQLRHGKHQTDHGVACVNFGAEFLMLMLETLPL